MTRKRPPFSSSNRSLEEPSDSAECSNGERSNNKITLRRRHKEAVSRQFGRTGRSGYAYDPRYTDYSRTNPGARVAPVAAGGTDPRARRRGPPGPFHGGCEAQTAVRFRTWQQHVGSDRRV